MVGGWGLQSQFHVQPNYSVEVVLLVVLCCRWGCANNKKGGLFYGSRIFRDGVVSEYRDSGNTAVSGSTYHGNEPKNIQIEIVEMVKLPDP